MAPLEGSSSSNGRSRGLDAAVCKSEARERLLDILDGIRGRKNLVISQALASTLNLFVKASTLQEHGVDRFFFLENDNLDASQRNVVFLVWAEDVDAVQAVADQVQRLQEKSSLHHAFTVVWTPRRTLMSDKILEDSGVLGEVTIDTLPLYFLPLEDDLWTLSYSDDFRQLYHDRNPRVVYLAAQALMLLQQKHGLFPRIIGKGDYAHRLMELLLQMRLETADDKLLPSDHMESLIIIDRQVDPVTPLLTQLTYEGLLDEKYTIRQNEIELEATLINASESAGRTDAKRKVQLDSSDKLFDQLRNTNFSVVDAHLNKVAKRLQQDMQSRHEAQSTSELREFVHKLPAYQAEQQSLKLHISLTEDLLNWTQSTSFRASLEIQQNLVVGSDAPDSKIEESIARMDSLSAILRLICLESCVSGGIRQKDLDNWKLLIVQAYGYQHLLTLAALEKCNLLQLRGKTSGTNYANLRKPLQLVVDETDETNPTDPAYVFSGYAPLSARLVQAIVLKKSLVPKATSNALGWHGLEQILTNVAGSTFSKAQHGNQAAVKARNSLQAMPRQRTLVVMLVGGITFAEIAALRLLSSQVNSRFLILTTSVTSGGRIMESLII